MSKSKQNKMEIYGGAFFRPSWKWLTLGIKRAEPLNIQSQTWFGFDYISPPSAMQLWTAVIEGEMIVCLHQMLVTNAMVQKKTSTGKRCDQQNDLISIQKVGCIQMFYFAGGR